MTIPKLKRIKLSSERQVRNWLATNAGPSGPVMLVTCNKTSRDKFVSREAMRQAVLEHGWTAGRRYTLEGNLTGQVVSHP